MSKYRIVITEIEDDGNESEVFNEECLSVVMLADKNEKKQAELIINSSIRDIAVAIANSKQVSKAAKFYAFADISGIIEKINKDNEDGKESEEVSPVDN